MGRMTEADDAILRWWERVRLKFQDRADLLAERGWSRERISRFLRFDIEEAVPLARDLLDALIEPSSPALEAASDAGIDALLAMLEEGLIERAMSRAGRIARRDGRTLHRHRAKMRAAAVSAPTRSRAPILRSAPPVKSLGEITGPGDQS